MRSGTSGGDLLRVDAVEKTFGAVRAANRVSFAVREGEIFALLGPNGAGKTTVIRMLVGLIRPDAGTVTVTMDGATHRSVPPERLGYLPEDRGLYQDVPVLRTLVHFGVLRGMSRGDAERSARTWLDRFALGDRTGEPLKALSKGNQQKVQFVSAVLHRPRLAILDEPFSGLDPLNQDAFVEAIAGLRADGTTVLLSAHQMELVERLADRVLLMSRGREVLHGTIPELRRRWSTGTTRLVLRVAAHAEHAGLDGHPAVHAVERPSPEQVVVLAREGADLGDLLVAIGSRLPVLGVHSEPVTLHEIYVRTVEASLAEDAGAQGAAGPTTRRPPAEVGA
jgi:ABC-2 type transport system ATP-binding protein